MSSFPHNKLKKLAADYIVAGMGLSGSHKLVFVTSSYTPDPDTNFMSSATAAECATTGYTRKTLANVTATQDDTNDLAKITWDAVSYTNIGVPAGSAVRYGLHIFDTGSDATSPILAEYELNGGSDFSLNGGALTITPNASGALTLT